MSAALLPGATITLTRDAVPASCDGLVRVRIEGNYNYFFYQILRLFGHNPPNTVNVIRESRMRWEHQC
jgi:hypothetical protein